MKDFAHILQQLMEEQAISASELGRRTGIGQPVIFRIASGETGDPKVGTMSALSKYFDISISQLIGDEPLPKNRRAGTHRPAAFGWSKAPLLTWESVTGWPKNRQKFDELDYIVTDAEVSASVFALRVKDTTMRPLFPEGTLLIVDPEIKPQDRDYAIIHVVGQKQAIFRQVLFDGHKTCLKPLNSDFKLLPVSSKHKFLGVLVQSKADFTRG